MQPIANVYGRITRKGAIRTRTRRGHDMVRFTVSVHVESDRPRHWDGREVKDPEKRRRKPWWINCLVFNSEFRQRAESLGPHEYAALVGRISRHRWYDSNGEERTEWTMYVDHVNVFVSGQRHPDQWEPDPVDTGSDDDDSVDTAETPIPEDAETADEDDKAEPPDDDGPTPDDEAE